MTKFCVITLFMMTTLAASTGLVRLVGIWRSTSNRLLRFGLGRCIDDLPCFRGVSPGRTSWHDAQATFAPLGDVELASSMTIIMHGPYGDLTYSRSLDHTAVGAIFIEVPLQERLPLGDLIQEYGPPCQIGIKTYLDKARFTLYYGLFYADVQIADDLTMNAAIRHVGLYDPASLTNDSCLHRNPRAQHFDRSPWYGPWEGFTSIRHYWTPK